MTKAEKTNVKKRTVEYTLIVNFLTMRNVHKVLNLPLYLQKKIQFNSKEDTRELSSKKQYSRVIIE